MKYLKLALLTTRKSKFIKIQEPQFLSSIVITYSLLDSITKAEKYLKEIESNPSQNTEGKNKSSYFEALMYLSFAKKDYTKALEYGKIHLNLVNKKSHSSIRQANKCLSNLYDLLGNEKMAFSHFKVYNKIKDSITSVQKVKALSYYQTLYETEKKTLKIKAQESDIDLLNEKNKVKNQFIAFGSIGILVFFGLILLVRSRNKAKENQVIQEQFSQQLLQTQEDERTRIANDLHDSVGQKLNFISRKSQNLKQDEISDLTTKVIDEVRSISRGLYPVLLTQFGLTESIKQLVLDYDEETDLFFTSEIESIDDSIDKNESLNLYRFVQECINNIIKHADAKAVSISIEKVSNTINVVINDNGNGFDTNDAQKRNSLGLKTLKERIRILNGKLIIKSKLSHGTSIIAKFPVK